MSVTAEDIEKVSHLAKISVSKEKAEKMKNDLNKVLHFVEQLSEVDCSGIDDSVEYEAKLHERADIVEETDPDVMDNAPEKECNMFVVPKVLG
ncbi:MAG: Asp-tRNA(Asn)/Glu-tRNA(Gln) amidotransferase subunit GatC [Alphaproteobacteria bacterium]|nr:Asp-tRNA(Asn)/Glu-tRNA(Gln) amidotransferase subunit GatC [Alphaproteobacteria bacterium]